VATPSNPRLTTYRNKEWVRRRSRLFRQSPSRNSTPKNSEPSGQVSDVPVVFGPRRYRQPATAPRKRDHG
jgi:hypothetical protein